MKSFGKLIEKTVKVAGIVSKVGIELGADLVGKVAEKVDDRPETREKYSTIGKKAGRTIKEYTSNAGKIAGEAIDSVIHKGVKAGSQLGSELASMTSEAMDILSSKINKLRKNPTSRKDFIENVTYDIVSPELLTEAPSNKVIYKPCYKDLELMISGIFESITRDINKTTLEYHYRDIFNKKRARALSLEEYRQSLLRNTWYYAEMGPQMLSLLRSHLENQALPDFEEYLKLIEPIQKKFREKSRSMDFSRMSEDIEQLEFSYKYHNIYTDLIFMFVNGVTNKENVELKREIVLYSPKEIVDICKKHLDFSTNVALDNIDFKF